MDFNIKTAPTNIFITKIYASSEDYYRLLCCRRFLTVNKTNMSIYQIESKSIFIAKGYASQEDVYGLLCHRRFLTANKNTNVSRT